MRHLVSLLVIVLFASSAVVLGARDIRKRLSPPTDAERAQIQEMIRDWKGDSVIPAQRAAIDKEHIPHRPYGSYLPSGDLARIKKFLVKLIKSDEPEAKK